MMQMESYNKQSVIFRSIPRNIVTLDFIRLNIFVQVHVLRHGGVANASLAKLIITRRWREQHNYWLISLNTLKSTSGPLT
jgi:hypothetical protein